MLAIMGTSTCHVMNGDALAEVPGMCGVVDGGIVPGLWGYEAGQSGVGDIFGWFVEHAVPPRYHDEARARGLDVHDHLSELAGEQEVGEHGLIALDWNNGNRSVLVDHELSGLIVGLTLATRAEDVYRALIEATAFGTRDDPRDVRGGRACRCSELFVAGGLLKNPVVMQIYADVPRMPLHLIGSDQGPALGSAMHAAVAAGAHPDIHAAAAAMGGVTRDAYVPDERARRRLRRALRALRARCTTTSAAAATTSCTRCATCARGSWSVADSTALRREVCALHAELPRNGLVAWTSGNLSARVPGEELMVIKASGVPYDELDAGRDRRLRPRRRSSSRASCAPSSDAATHGYIYRELPRGRRHRPHPQRVRDRVGDPRRADPVRDDRDGRRVRRRDPGRPVRADRRRGDRPRRRRDARRATARRAVLMRSHGVFTVGAGPRDAIKAAVMCEDAARTVHLARALGDAVPLDQEDIDALYDRYQNVYGQR